MRIFWSDPTTKEAAEKIWLPRARRAVQISFIATLLIFTFTFALLVLAQYSYVSALSPLFTLGATFAFGWIPFALRKEELRVAKDFGIELDKKENRVEEERSPDIPPGLAC